MENSCPNCQKQIERRDHWMRHVWSCHFGKKLMCQLCKKLFTRREHWRRHVWYVHRLRPEDVQEPVAVFMPQEQQAPGDLPPATGSSRVNTSPLASTDGPAPQQRPGPTPMVDLEEKMDEQPEYACPDCDGKALYLPWNKLSDHLQDQHGWDMTGEMNLSKEDCENLFGKKKINQPELPLRPTQASRSAPEWEEADDDEWWGMQELRNPPPLGGYKCNFCIHQFDKLRDLERHLFSIHGIRMTFPYVGRTIGNPLIHHPLRLPRSPPPPTAAAGAALPHCANLHMIEDVLINEDLD